MTQRLAGRAVFLAGLAVWIAVGARLLPYDFSDLGYLLSAEKEFWTIPEWMHPLFVPLLGLYRAGLSVFGYSGTMLLPLQWLNMGVGAAALTGLFLFTEEQCGDSLSAALAVLVLGYTPAGFWSGCLRSTPYAAASAAVVACLILLSGGKELTRRRLLWAGVAAGLAASFHMAAIALIPVAAAAAWSGEGRARRFAGFLAAFAAVLLAAYVVFIGWHRIEFAALRQLMDRNTLRAIEQEPMSSIYSSRSVSLQLATFTNTLLNQGSTTRGWSLALAAAAAVLAWKRSRAGRRALYLAVASFFSFSAFFAINNSQNGFIFSALLSVPLILARAVSGAVWLRLPFIAFAALDLSQSVTAMQSSVLSAERNSLLREVALLQSRLGPRDVLLTPGCPFMEIYYLRHLHVVRVGSDAPSFQNQCEVPYAGDEKALRRRIEDYLREGRSVLLAEGNLDFTPAGDVPGDWKIHQVFWPAAPDLDWRRRDVEALRVALAAHFRLGPRIISPGGASYLPVSLPRSARSPGPMDKSGPPLRLADFQKSHDSVRRRLNPQSIIVHRLDYLQQWLTLDPQDRGVRKDLDEILEKAHQ